MVGIVSHTAHSVHKGFQCCSVTGVSVVQRRSRCHRSTHKGRSQEIGCPPKFLLSIAPRCPSPEVGYMSEIAKAVGFTDAGHRMEALLRFKGQIP
ncbi:hypothetical protein AVEN_19655-1 [Araneus ventricosus]|uniref:Uncharacterized protein n=1 Tax=Araneus ventricosus TaxID=182803 RepID=A0A4Y2C5K7_ARAVE|nr:hypothetical protein AVEN_19655-1 [Araneus ventricosus]